jgi:hypothetical protein
VNPAVITRKKMPGHQGPGKEENLQMDTYPAGQPGRKPPASRIHHLARRIHRLGERPLAELLLELVDGADPLERLEEYARLDQYRDFIRANRGDRLPPLRVIGGGR